MGACFGSKPESKKSQKTPHHTKLSSSLTNDNLAKYSTSDEKREDFLKISCKSPSFELSLRYRQEVPIYDLKDQISKSKPNLDITKYSIHKGKLEVLDPTATLRQLGILANDHLRLKRVKEVEFPAVELSNIRLQSSINNPSIVSHAIKESEFSILSIHKSQSLVDISEEDSGKNSSNNEKFRHTKKSHKHKSRQKSAKEL